MIEKNNEIFCLYLDSFISSTPAKEGNYTDNSEVTFKDVRDKINSANPKEIVVVINSPGGNLMEAFAIYDFLKELQSKGIKVSGVGYGFVASSATIILSACETRSLTEHTTYMIHDIEGSISGTPREIKSYSEYALSIRQKVLDVYTSITSITAEEVEKLVDNATFLTSEEALKKGFITNIIKKEDMNLEMKNFNNSYKNESLDEEKIARSIFDKVSSFFKNTKEVKEPEVEEKASFKEELLNSIKTIIKEEVNDAIANFKNSLDSSEEKSKAEYENIEMKFKNLNEEIEKLRSNYIENVGGVPIASEKEDNNKYQGIKFYK